MPSRARSTAPSEVQFHKQLRAAIGAERGTEAANRLCTACVEFLDVDAAAISLIFDGANLGTLGASSPEARRYDEVQFTLGEGPCLESLSRRRPVLVADLADTAEVRWPAYSPAMLAHDIRSVHALPVSLAGQYVGALDLFRARPGPLGKAELAGALAAAVLAELPILDLLADDMRAALTDPDSDAWDDLHILTRVEVSQATGMLIEQLNVEPGEALVRLRAYAYANNRSATDVARDILDNGLRIGDEGDQR